MFLRNYKIEDDNKPFKKNYSKLSAHQVCLIANQNYGRNLKGRDTLQMFGEMQT